MKTFTVIFAWLFITLFIAFTQAQVPSTSFVKLPRIGSHKRALHFSSSSYSTPDQISQQLQEQQHLVNTWLLPLKLYKKRDFSGIAFQDDDLLIPLMKKGHIPRGPPRFGKRGGGVGGFGSPSNHMRLRQFSLYRPMMQLLPRNQEIQEYNPNGF